MAARGQIVKEDLKVQSRASSVSRGAVSKSRAVGVLGEGGKSMRSTSRSHVQYKREARERDPICYDKVV